MDELLREAESQLSLRLRGARKSLKQRLQSADAANLDAVPLFTMCIQWPKVMDALQSAFFPSQLSSPGLQSPHMSVAFATRMAQRYLTSSEQHGSIVERDFVDALWHAAVGHVESVAQMSHRGGSVPSTSRLDAAPESPSELRSQERQYKQQFRRVFRTCDSRCRGQITWDDLTSYLLDSAMLMKHKREAALAQREWYVLSDPVRTQAHRPRLLKCQPGGFLVVDGSGSLLSVPIDTLRGKWYDLRKSEESAAPTLLLIIDCEYVPWDHGLCFSTVGAELYYVELQFNNMERILVDDSIQMLSVHLPTKKVVGGDREGRVTLWGFHKRNPAKRAKTPQLLGSIVVKKGVPVQSIACGTERDVIAAGCEDGTVCIMTSTTPDPVILRIFTTAPTTINAVALAEQQNIIAVATASPVPELWSLEGGGQSAPFTLQARVMPHQSPVVSILCVRGAPQCVTMDFAGIVKVWHTQLLTCLQTFVIEKNDPRNPWRSMIEVGGFILFTDRIEIRAIHVVEEGEPLVDPFEVLRSNKDSLIMEHPMLQRGPVSAALRLTTAAPPGSITDEVTLIVTSAGHSVHVWDAASQRIAAQVQAVPDNESITCLCCDTEGNRLFVGTSSGTALILNATTMGVLEAFPHVCSPSIVAITYLADARVGIACGENGVGMFLQSPSKVSTADILHQRGQVAFVDMNAGICCSTGLPLQLLVTADRRHTLHFSSTSEAQRIWKMVHLTQCPIPDSLRGEQRNAAAAFLPAGRCIVDVKPLVMTVESRSALFLVADSFSIVIVALHGASSLDLPPPPFKAAHNLAATVLAQWNLFSAFDASIAGVLHHYLSAEECRAIANAASINETAQQQQPEMANHSLASDEVGALLDSVTSEDAQSQFLRGMDALIRERNKAAELVLDPQIVLLQNQVQWFTSVVSGNGNGGARTPLITAQDYFVVAFESGTVVVLDASGALRNCHHGDTIQAELAPLRLAKLKTAATLLAPLDKDCCCIGRGDGLIDVLEVPSLGLMWSGLPAIAEAADYFPPTASLSVVATPAMKSLITVQRDRVGHIHKSASFAPRTDDPLLSSPSSISMSAGKGGLGRRFSRNVLVDDAASDTASGAGLCRNSSVLSSISRASTIRGPGTTSDDDSISEQSTGGGILRTDSVMVGGKSTRDGRSSPRKLSENAVEGLWVLSQLATLCGDRSLLFRSDDANRSKQGEANVHTEGKYLRTTPSGIVVLQGNDPFTDCCPVDAPGSPGAGGTVQRVVPKYDHRKSRKQRQQEKLTVKNTIPLKSFDDLGVDRPSSSRSFLPAPGPAMPLEGIDLNVFEAPDSDRMRLFTALSEDTTVRLPAHLPHPMLRGSLLRPLSGSSAPSIRASSASSKAIPRATSSSGQVNVRRPSSSATPPVVVGQRRVGCRSSSSLDRFRCLAPVEIPSWLPQ